MSLVRRFLLFFFLKMSIKNTMRKIHFLSLALLCLFNLYAFSQTQELDTYDYNNLVTSIKGVSSPYISGDYIVFTAQYNSRFVGIAFDFENYKTIHPFYLHKTINYEGDITSSWYFYILEKPKNIQKISYRLVMDGLWTVDPYNPNSYYNRSDNTYLSYIDIPYRDDSITKKVDETLTRFVCIEEPGQKIRLGGTFTNWDSWIYEMQELEPGKYELFLPLPSGTYYYSYYKGITAFTDKTNPAKGYSSDGRVVSCITID